MGSISLERGSDRASHGICNQRRFQDAPQPHDPAEEMKMLVGGSGQCHEGDAIPVGYGSTERSVQKSLLRRTRWWPLEANGPDSRFIMRRRNERPGWTTLCNLPPFQYSSLDSSELVGGKAQGPGYGVKFNTEENEARGRALAFPCRQRERPVPCK